LKLSTNLVVDNLRDVADPAGRIEKMGFSTLAFSRNPMVLAYLARDLQNASKGRFILGLGTQVKAHNARCFGFKWDRPGPKLREYIVAIRAIWDCFQNDTKHEFEGEFFKCNLMTPMFNLGALPFAPSQIYIGAVNPWNCMSANT